MTTTFSPEAQQLFDQYIATVRWSVRGVADAGEIERDVREHVTSALEEQQQPVSSHTLRAVLAKLGDPWEWIPAEELPLWKRLMMRFSLGPEDWRLAYVCFTATIVGLFLIPVGGIVLLAGAYLLGRASYDLASDRESDLGPRRWLVYPVLAFFAFFIVAALLAGVPALLIAAGIEGHAFNLMFDASHFNLADEAGLALFQVGSSAVVTGIWLVVLSGLVALAVRPLRWILVPFAYRLRRVHALWLTGLGVVVAAGGAALLMHGV